MPQSHNTDELLRPRNFALLLLASGDALPRQRARDQQADRAGLRLKCEMLLRLAELDPDPEHLDAVLMRIVDELGAPTGPTRAIAAGVRDDWQVACEDPQFVEHLLREALRDDRNKRRNKRRGAQGAS